MSINLEIDLIMIHKEKKILTAIYQLLQTDCEVTIKTKPGNIIIVIDTKNKNIHKNQDDIITKIKK